MALDPYAPCPCGNGKKLKFCDCAKDMLGDLERVITLLDADQRVAGLDQIDKLIASKGERPALLALKATACLEAADVDGARQVVARFLEKQPDNPLALAQGAILDMADDSLASAVDKLQLALAHIGTEIPITIYEAIGLIGRALLSKGNILGARGHLLLQASIGGAENSSGLRMLTQILSSPQVPLLLRQDFVITPPPANAPWKKEFEEAAALADKGAWKLAAEKLAPLADRLPREAVPVKAAAVYRGYAGDTAGAAAAWRRYAAIPNLPLDDAVEAEALAQLIDEEAAEPQVDVVSIEYLVEDAQVVMERLLSDKRCVASPVDPAEFAAEGEPPPKGLFWLLDRPALATSEGLTREAIPCVIGELILHGRQTDRSARLEFVVSKTESFAAKTKALSQMLFGLVGAAGKEEVVEQMSLAEAALSFNWRLPNDTSPELRRKLLAEQARETLLSAWPSLPMAALDGKRPAEVAANPAYRVRLLGAILRYELSRLQETQGLDFNELRRKLGLAVSEPLDPAATDVKRLPLVRFLRLPIEKLTDETLAAAYARGAGISARRIVLPLVQEVIARPSLADKVDLAQAHAILAALTEDHAAAFAAITKAREIAVARGESAAPWMLDELSMRIVRQDAEGAQRVLRQIQTRYQRDENVMRGLAQVLVRHGLISPDGRPVGPPPGAVPAPLPEPAAAPAGKFWTPEGAAATSAGEGKSKLWLPGMD